MEDAKNWSYLYFRNGASGKLYYYFINNIEYVNDATVELFLEMDVIQTFMFNWTLLPSFVERQHVTDDTVGLHTQEEGLDPGEYRVANAYHVTDMDELCIMVLTSITLNGDSKETTVNAYGSLYNNVFSGLKLYAIPLSNWSKWSTQLDNLSEWGKIDGITAMWMYPKAFVTLGGEQTWTDDDMAKVVSSTKALTYGVSLAQSGEIDGYTPKNNKLYTYPYNLLYATNNNGASAVYRYERFTGSEASFRIVGALSPDAGARLFPNYNYNGADAYNDGLTMGAYPSCAWDADGYKIWLAQNQNQHDLTMTSGTIKAAVGGITAIGSLVGGSLGGAAGGVGMVYSGAMDIASLLAAKEDKSIEPPQARGTFSSNLNVVAGKQHFTFLRKTITAEYARRIDDYFTMYGYKINRVQVPNIHARENYTYVKTINCNVHGNFSNEEKTQIMSIFDRGITFWANGNTLGDYSLSNNPI